MSTQSGIYERTRVKSGPTSRLSGRTLNASENNSTGEDSNFTLGRGNKYIDTSGTRVKKVFSGTAEKIEWQSPGKLVCFYECAEYVYRK